MSETRDPAYIHGVEPVEQARLAALNDLLNPAMLEVLAPGSGDRVLDAGSGLGQFTRAIARRVGPAGRVVGVERSEAQLTAARAAPDDPGSAPVEFRLGDAAAPPLDEDEWGAFDLAHCRFVLEHAPAPERVVAALAGAVRPGGRVFLADDDHDLLRLWPEAPGVERLWRAYIGVYRALGADPFVGRRLTGLLHLAGCAPTRTAVVDFGACAGDARFGPLVRNLAGILRGARANIARLGLLDDEEIDRAMDDLHAWAGRPDAAIWYVVLCAEGRRPG
ncbi:MAG: methyltransferase domain-containing protein [Planctomycetota bacterium]|nr:MAG: methyltransferase domain-containing protein [Planctomycetota bacterium]